MVSSHTWISCESVGAGDGVVASVGGDHDGGHGGDEDPDDDEGDGELPAAASGGLWLWFTGMLRRGSLLEDTPGPLSCCTLA